MELRTDRRRLSAMKEVQAKKKSRAGDGRPEPVLSTGAADPMSADQEATLRRLAEETLEHEAFSRRLTATEAAQRIAILQAKLKLMSHPPHTA